MLKIIESIIIIKTLIDLLVIFLKPLINKFGEFKGEKFFIACRIECIIFYIGSDSMGASLQEILEIIEKFCSVASKLNVIALQ
jgi:hypothetical protein